MTEGIFTLLKGSTVPSLSHLTSSLINSLGLFWGLCALFPRATLTDFINIYIYINMLLQKILRLQRLTKIM